MIKLILFFLLIGNNSFSQIQNNFWYTGYFRSMGLPLGPSALDFKNGSPDIYYDSLRIMNFDFAEASVSDSAGNILFYTNGVWIANATGDTMVNGFGINPSSYTTQNANDDDDGIRITAADLILPYPEHPNQYILFHETSDDVFGVYPAYLYSTIIDMMLDSGRGSVISKNQIIINDTLQLGQVVACKHANGRDWWIVLPERAHTNYYVILLTPNGPSVQSIQNIGVRVNSTGQAVFSPDGTTYASYDATTDLEVYDFDRCTGLFSNARHVTINDSMFGIGISFSPDSRKIYCSSSMFLYQFDLDNPNLADYDTVAVWDGFASPSINFPTKFFTQALRTDGKIYITTTAGTDRLHTIDYPDIVGLACMVNQHSITLPTYNKGTCPTFPNYFLGPVVGSICDSLTGVNEIDFNLSTRLYPNPAKENTYLNYEFEYGVNGWVELYDMQGRMVYKQRLYWSTKQLLLHTEKFANGMYAVMVRDEMGNRVTKKLIVNH